MPDQPISKYAHDTANARRLLLEEVREHRARHGQPVTVVWARYGTGSFNAAIITEELPGMVAEMDRIVEREDLSVKDLRSALFDMMRHNKHFEDGKGAATHTLLWLLCRTSREVREIAEKGDCAIGYEIGSRELPDGGHGVKFRLIFPNGRYDGFSSGDIEVFGVRQVGHAASIADYQFENVMKLSEDFKSGLFTLAVRQAMWDGR